MRTLVTTITVGVLTLVSANAWAQVDVPETGTATIVSDSEETYRLVVRHAGHTVAECTTPCTLHLAPGRYQASAWPSSQVLLTNFRVEAGAIRRVHFGGDDFWTQRAGSVLIEAGMWSAAIAMDNLAAVALPPEARSIPWAANYLDFLLPRDITLATGLVLLPTTLAFLLPGATLFTSRSGRGTAVEDITARRVMRPYFRNLYTEGQVGGGIVGAAIVF